MKRTVRSKNAVVTCLFLFAWGNEPAAQDLNPPRVTAVEPNAAVTTPGAKVKVHGMGFSSGTVIYFGGLQVREMSLDDPSTLEVVTPYLRPGSYALQIRSGESAAQSDVTFTAMPSEIDTMIDRAIKLAAHGQVAPAIATLTSIATRFPDYQVRAFAHYQMGQIYFTQGDFWRWGGETASIFDPQSGSAAQTSWRYRLAYAKSVYLLPIGSDADATTKLANWAVKFDVTQNPEPRFFRGLINARYGNLDNAKADSDWLLRREPDNLSFQSLAAYISVLAGGHGKLESFANETVSDAIALRLLGEAAYLSGDTTDAQHWWVQAAKAYPLGANIAYWTGKKHLTQGQKRVAEALLNECIAIAPDSKDAKDAQGLLATLGGSLHQ